MIPIPHFIHRRFIQNNKDIIFVYGYDIAGKGIFGQAWECHGEENAIPIFTCLKMCKSSGYFSDSMIHEIIKRNSEQITKIKRLSVGKIVVVLPKIGEGASRMKEFAPKSYKWLRDELDKIHCKDIQYVY